MIASVTGTVAARRPDHVVVDCGGVGYRLSVSSQTLEQGAGGRQEASLLAHLILRDDGIHLYGFAREAERELFLKLISVAGVGPKMALAVLSGSTSRRDAQGNRGRRRQALSGRARHRQARRPSGSSSSCARRSLTSSQVRRATRRGR